MSILWIDRRNRRGIASLEKNSITFNTTALESLKSFRYVMVGIDEEHKTIIIKPISNNQYIKEDISKELIYNLSVSKTYGRISNKELFVSILEAFGDVLSKNNKFSTYYKDGLLYIDLNKEVWSNV